MGTAWWNWSGGAAWWAHHSRVRTVQIGSKTEFLRLTSRGFSPPDELEVELRGDGLRAQVAVTHRSSGFGDLAGFATELARDWRGWSGSRDWTSLEGDLRIEARHEHGHVPLRATLRRYGAGRDNEGWTARVDLVLEPGEQLTQIASELRALAGGG